MRSHCPSEDWDRHVAAQERDHEEQDDIVICVRCKKQEAFAPDFICDECFIEENPLPW